MLASFIRSTKKVFHNRLPGEFLLLSSILIALLAVFFSSVVIAQDNRPDNAAGYYAKDGEVNWISSGDNSVALDMRGLTTSDVERLYPMSPEAEAAIIHPELSRPVIVDGVRYEGKQISLFNGHRLYFVIGKDKTLYAFTRAKGLEEFQADYSRQPLRQYSGPESIFFRDWWYSGGCFNLFTGYGLPNLSQIGFDNVISSVRVSVTASWAFLYDYFDYQGNCLAIPGGADLVELFQWGWNDRASSVGIE